MTAQDFLCKAVLREDFLELAVESCYEDEHRHLVHPKITAERHKYLRF